MIENSRADVNGANMYDNTCLMSAAYRGHMDIINHLLRKGARVDMKVQLPSTGRWKEFIAASDLSYFQSKCGTAALHLAADQGNVAVVRCLATTGGANIELVTNHGLTPAMVAANSAQHQVVEYLLDLIKSKTSTDSDQVWRSLMHFFGFFLLVKNIASCLFSTQCVLNEQNEMYYTFTIKQVNS